MAENKPVAIRMDEDTRTSLNEAAAQMGLSQGDTLKTILQNFQDARNFMEDDTKDLDDILHYINGLSDKFREIIRSRSEATERAKLKVSRQLETQLTTIEDLQKRLEESEAEIRELKRVNEHLIKENKTYEEQATSLFESRKLNNTLDRENRELREKIQKIEPAFSNSESVSEENRKLKETVSALQSDLNNLKETLSGKDRELEELRHTTIQKIEEARKETRDELSQFYRGLLSLNTEKE